MPTDDKNCALSEKRCQACRGGVEPLAGATLEAYRGQLDPAWEIRNETLLERTFTFRNFQQALDFTNTVGRLAEDEGHHPEITLTWGRATVRLWTHKIGGLHENDFILAAKIDRLRDIV